MCYRTETLRDAELGRHHFAVAKLLRITQKLHRVQGSIPIARSNLGERYRSGQTGQTVNLLAYAFTGSNPVLSTIFGAATPGGLARFEAVAEEVLAQGVEPDNANHHRQKDEQSGC
jgi:hypothetical protein